MKSFYFLIALVFAFFLTGCADAVSFSEAATVTPVGFWHGFWHGLILPISFFCSLFSDDIAIYAIYNSGGWYDFGFLLGCGGLASSSSSSSISRTRCKK